MADLAVFSLRLLRLFREIIQLVTAELDNILFVEIFSAESNILYIILRKPFINDLLLVYYHIYTVPFLDRQQFEKLVYLAGGKDSHPFLPTSSARLTSISNLWRVILRCPWYPLIAPCFVICKPMIRKSNSSPDLT